MPTIVASGQTTIHDSNDGISIVLTLPSVTLPADSLGNVTSYASAVTYVRVYLGGQDVTANWALTKSDGAGVISTLAGNMLTVTQLTVESGTVTLTASRPGYASMSAVFAASKVPGPRGGNLLDTSWWAPGDFRWNKYSDIDAETEIIWATGPEGTRIPVVRALADSINKLMTPSASTWPLTGWFTAMPAGAVDSFTLDTTIYRTATSSFKLVKSGGIATAARGRASRAVAVIPGQVLRVRVDVLGDSSTASGVYVAVFESNSLPISGAVYGSAATGITYLANNVPSSTTWVRHELTYTVPNGIYAISLAIYSWSGGPVTLWFDDPVINFASGPDSSTGVRGGPDGGWAVSAGNTVKIDPTKTYRFSVPVKRISPTAVYMRFYFRPQAGKVCTLNTSTIASNPAFIPFYSALPENEWVMATGYIYPAGSTGMDNGDTGLVSLKTGLRLWPGTSFCWSATATECGFEAFQFGCDIGSELLLGQPVVEVLDGTVSGNRVENYFASSDWDGVVAPDGTVTTPGTRGWLLAKGNGTQGSSRLEVDAAHVRGKLTTEQLQVGSATNTVAYDFSSQSGVMPANGVNPYVDIPLLTTGFVGVSTTIDVNVQVRLGENSTAAYTFPAGSSVRFQVLLKLDTTVVDSAMDHRQTCKYYEPGPPAITWNAINTRIPLTARLPSMTAGTYTISIRIYAYAFDANGAQILGHTPYFYLSAKLFLTENKV